jgi:uncharacterized membrane protein
MTQEPKPWKVATFAGSGMTIGAAMGLLVGLILLENGIASPLMGAAAGAVVGVIYGILSKPKRMD